MRRCRSYIAGVLLLSVIACNPNAKRLNERVTLRRDDKIPYGTYYCFSNLQHIFPAAEVVIKRQSPADNSGFNLWKNEFERKLTQNQKRSAQLVIDGDIRLNKEELQALLEFIWEGNYVFISAFHFDRALLDSLELQANDGHETVNMGDSLTVSVLHPETRERQTFTYPGKSYDSYFSAMDSTYTTILGMDEQGRANFVKIGYQSGGAIYLHLAPMALTNFFLLHKNNKLYYDYVFSQMPQGITLLGWGDYFRTRSNSNDDNNQPGILKQFAWILKQKALAIGLGLLLALFTLVLVFESKRRQLIIPEIPPLRNSSLDFVKTVARLYYQRKDNRNLANKMASHFLGYVRTRFTLPTSRLDENFEAKLAYKSGYSKEALTSLIYRIKTLPDMHDISDEELLAFNRELEQFYKQT